MPLFLENSLFLKKIPFSNIACFYLSYLFANLSILYVHLLDRSIYDSSCNKCFSNRGSITLYWSQKLSKWLCELRDHGNLLFLGLRAIVSKMVLCVCITEYTSHRCVGHHILYARNRAHKALTFISPTTYHAVCL